MYRYMAERMLMALHYVKDNASAPDKALVRLGQEYVRLRMNPDPELGVIFRNHFDMDPPIDTPYKVEDLIDNLKAQLVTLQQRENDGTGDLIEKLVYTLGLPFAHN